MKRLREFYYANFCDFYLETTKPIFKQKSNNFELEEIVWNILRNCNYYSLLMYHPIMPSITEELWQRNLGFGATNFNPQNGSSILGCSFPDTNDMSELAVNEKAINYIILENFHFRKNNFLKKEANIDHSNQVIKTIKALIYNVSNLKRTSLLNERPKRK